MKCLFCNSENLKKASFPRPTNFNNKVFTYVQCLDCDLIFINPLLDSNDYAELYKADYHEEFYFDARQIRNNEIVRIASKYRSGGRVLDYGCGDGWLLSEFTNRGFSGFGVEYDADLVEKLGVRYPGTKFKTIAQIDELSEERMDMVHMGDVLEHLTNPSEVLNKIKKILKDDGLLIVQGPLENNKHFALQVRKLISRLMNKGLSNHRPYHIIFSSAKNQLAFFERNGFKTIAYMVLETSWPYPETPKGGVGNAVKYGIAKFSRFLSYILPGKMGNRFIYIGRI